MGRFSSQNKVFIRKIPSRPCRDLALNKQDPAQPGWDEKRPSFKIIKANL